MIRLVYVTVGFHLKINHTTLLHLTMIFRNPRKVIKCMFRQKTFECLTVFVIISYLCYFGAFGNYGGGIKKGNTTKKLSTLFSVAHMNLPGGRSTVKSTRQVEKCPVTVAVILCQDDGYLTITKNKNDSHFRADVGTKIVAKDFSRQINQTLALLKSISILSKYEAKKSCVEILILSDKLHHFKQIKSEINRKWSKEFQQLIRLTNVPVRYPPESAWMKRMFRPCATLRLFLAELLPANSWDSVIYLDTDVIFLQSVQTLWSEFERFDETSIIISNNGQTSSSSEIGPDSSKKLAAMAPCLFHYGSSSNAVPYFGSSGLNAGIMLMNLTRMRGAQWTNKIRMVTTMFRDKIKLADQDILNIYFHFFPEELHLLTCDWNFRPFQCRRESTCEDAELNHGISALHGNALSFTPQGPEPLFNSIFQTFHRTKMDQSFSLEKLVEQLEASLLVAEDGTHRYNSQCKQFGSFDVLALNRLYSLIIER